MRRAGHLTSRLCRRPRADDRGDEPGRRGRRCTAGRSRLWIPNKYYGEVMCRFPGRFLGLAQIREWEAERESELEGLEQAIAKHGNVGFYSSVESWALNGLADRVDDPKFGRLWDRVRALDIPVWFYLDSRRRDRLTDFMARVGELDRRAEAHLDIPAVITHGLVPAALIPEIGFPEEVIALLKWPNMPAELLAPAKSPEYPYVEGQELIHRLRGDVGAEKLMWGQTSRTRGTGARTGRPQIAYVCIVASSRRGTGS